MVTFLAHLNDLYIFRLLLIFMFSWHGVQSIKIPNYLDFFAVLLIHHFEGKESIYIHKSVVSLLVPSYSFSFRVSSSSFIGIARRPKLNASTNGLKSRWIHWRATSAQRINKVNCTTHHLIAWSFEPSLLVLFSLVDAFRNNPVFIFFFSYPRTWSLSIKSRQLDLLERSNRILSHRPCCHQISV